MEAVFYNNNIYVLLKGIPDYRNKEVANDSRFSFSLQGLSRSITIDERLTIKQVNMNTFSLLIDGKQVQIIDCYEGKLYLRNGFSLELTIAYLNQIHNCGIDKFLANYKKAMTFVLSETKRLGIILADDDVITLKKCINSLNEESKTKNYFEKMAQRNSITTLIDYLAKW